MITGNVYIINVVRINVYKCGISVSYFLIVCGWKTYIFATIFWQMIYTTVTSTMPNFKRKYHRHEIMLMHVPNKV